MECSRINVCPGYGVDDDVLIYVLMIMNSVNVNFSPNTELGPLLHSYILIEGEQG